MTHTNESPGFPGRFNPLTRLAKGFRVELVDAGERNDNGYLRAPRFAIHRIRKTA